MIIHTSNGPSGWFSNPAPILWWTSSSTTPNLSSLLPLSRYSTSIDYPCFLDKMETLNQSADTGHPLLVLSSHNKGVQLPSSVPLIYLRLGPHPLPSCQKPAVSPSASLDCISNPGCIALFASSETLSVSLRLACAGRGWSLYELYHQAPLPSTHWWDWPVGGSLQEIWESECMR